MCKGHKNAVLDVKWHPDSTQIHSCGADKQVFSWDSADFSRLRSYKGHEQIVNSIACTVNTDETVLLATGSDDCTVKLWDQRSKNCATTFNLGY